MRSHVITLNAGGAAFSEGEDLVKSGHGGIVGVGCDQCAMGPSEAYCFIFRFAREKTIEKSGGEAVASADTIQDIQLASRRGECLSIDPRDCAPGMAVRGVYFAQCRGHDFYVRM